ncbi:MAG: hypothetical protein ABIK33_02970 [candidate division WOR-3 bacterium]
MANYVNDLADIELTNNYNVWLTTFEIITVTTADFSDETYTQY